MAGSRVPAPDLLQRGLLIARKLGGDALVVEAGSFHVPEMNPRADTQLAGVDIAGAAGRLVEVPGKFGKALSLLCSG